MRIIRLYYRKLETPPRSHQILHPDPIPPAITTIQPTYIMLIIKTSINLPYIKPLLPIFPCLNSSPHPTGITLLGTLILLRPVYDLGL